MAHRYVRNTAILAKAETTYGTDSVPTGAANAMLVSNLTIAPFTAQNVMRNNIKPYFGADEELVGTKYVTFGFDIELAGSGTAGSRPAYGDLLLACAMAEVVTASVSVEYNPITNNQGSVTMYWYDDGLLHKVTGAKGTFDLKMGIGIRPVLSFKFTGLYTDPAAVANPGVTYTGFKRPLAITDQNTADITFGGTYATAAVTGGTPYSSRGLDIVQGVTPNFIPLLGGDSVDVTDRQMTMKLELDLSAAAEAQIYTSVVANQVQSVSLQHGLTPGNLVLVFAPAVQLTNPGKADQNGRRLVSLDGRLVPVLGNDEFLLCLK